MQKANAGTIALQTCHLQDIRFNAKPFKWSQYIQIRELFPKKRVIVTATSVSLTSLIIFVLVLSAILKFSKKRNKVLKISDKIQDTLYMPSFFSDSEVCHL